MPADLKPLWVKHYPKHWLDDTIELSPLEEMVYRRLDDLIVFKNDELRDDDRALAWQTKAGRNWSRIKARLIELGKIEIADGFIRSRRATEACIESRSCMAQKSGAGHASAKKRKLRKTQGSTPTGVATDVGSGVPYSTRITVHAPTEHEAGASAIDEEQGEKTIGQRLYGEGLTILAKLIGEPLPEKRDKMARLLRKMQGEAGDDAMLLSIILDAGAKPPRDPVPWIKSQIKVKKAPRLVVDNADPDDRWGVNAWCASLPGIKPSDPEDRHLAQWDLHGVLIDGAATRVCEAARLPARWRGNLDPIAGWAADGIGSEDASRVIDRIASREGYVASEVRSMAFFDAAVREARRAA